MDSNEEYRDKIKAVIQTWALRSDDGLIDEITRLSRAHFGQKEVVGNTVENAEKFIREQWKTKYAGMQGSPQIGYEMMVAYANHVNSAPDKSEVDWGKVFDENANFLHNEPGIRRRKFIDTVLPLLSTQEQPELSDEVIKHCECNTNAINEINGICVYCNNPIRHQEEKSGFELIGDERLEHFTKHGRTVELDAFHNSNFELRIVASALLHDGKNLVGEDDPRQRIMRMPPYWHKLICLKMAEKSYKDRLITAGAMIAAEIDRIIYITSPLRGAGQREGE